MRRFLAPSLLLLLGAVGASVSYSAPVERTSRGYVNIPSVDPAPRAPRPFVVPALLPDVVQPLNPAEVQLTGYLGARVTNSEANRLLHVDEEELLAGFRKRPGKQAWIGEHVGKFIHAATLAWANTGDRALREKLDRVVAELLKTQEADGYLGTYTPEKRFQVVKDADWDVWVHKYDLLGLLTYYQYTGNRPALEASQRIGELLLNTFGPGKKSIISAGTHVGMASTSVLEPVVMLYRVTGDPRYLEFGKYVVTTYDEEKGPKILKTLLAEKSVRKTANGKAYEMLSNLVGLCELAQVSGDRQLLEAARNGWQDVKEHQLYLTGTASHKEHFRADDELPNQKSADVGETCVTVTWIQLNAQLLRLTGEAKYADELERSYYNHLSAAQRPDGSEWCYYTSLEGTKPYGHSTNCCLSSGPRGMALAPTLAYFKYVDGGSEGLAVNLFETSTTTLAVNGQTVRVEQRSEFPYAGRTTLTLHLDHPVTFPLEVRSPEWAAPLTARVAGETADTVRGPKGGWARLAAREWHDGDRVTIRFDIPARMIPGDSLNKGMAALAWGPLVLSYDEKANEKLPAATLVGLTDSGRKPPFRLISAPGMPLQFEAPVRTLNGSHPETARFVPFGDAGATGGWVQVWLRGPGVELPLPTITKAN